MQVFKQSSNTSKVIKIKNAFLALSTKKINQIQNIVNGNPKPKLCIQITTKELSRKQIITSMSSNNIKKFMKNSSLYVARSLRNVKLEVLVDFIYSNQTGIMMVTSKVALQLDLHIIKNYVKNVNDINISGIEVPQLLQSKSYLKIIGIPYFPLSQTSFSLYLYN